MRQGADARPTPLDDRGEIKAVELLDLTDAEREPIDRWVRRGLADGMSGGLRRIPLVPELQEAIASADAGKIDSVKGRYAATRPIDRGSRSSSGGSNGCSW